jgi:hypothetical protein
MRTRIAIGAIGIIGILWGAAHLLIDPHKTHLIGLIVWLGAGLVLHDGVLVPVIAVIGFVLTKYVPAPMRSYIQGALVTMGVVTIVALPLIYRHGKTLPGKTLLERDYARNLIVILGLIVAVAVAAYVVRMLREESSGLANSTNDLPPADQESMT